MRKILILLLFVSSACERGLEVEPKMYISAKEAFSNKENVDAALVGCYDALQLQHYYGRNFVIIGDLASDNSRASGTKIEYYSTDDNNLLSDNILVEGIWSDIYTAINRVNYVLTQIDGLDFLNTSEKEDISGQLRFLRGLHYFNLVRLYGGVPLKLLPTDDVQEDNFLPRSSTNQVYDQIIADLEYSILNLKNTLPERATVFAAKTCLSMVNLSLGNFGDALNYSKEVFDSINFLEEKYSELFDHQGEPSREIIFYVPFSPSDKNRLAEYLLPNPLGGRYENSPTPKLVSLIEENDARRNLIAARYKDKYYSTKYSDLTTGSDRVIVYRTAELLFIMAEAAYRIDSVGNLTDILNSLNKVRVRAGLPALEELVAGSIWNAIQKEKQIEFAFEGKRWFDLIRTHTAIGTVPTVTTAYQKLWPLPLSEMLANPNIGIQNQNDGY